MLIDPLLLEVRTYGLHLQTLDIRQHAKVHAKAVAEISAWQLKAGSRAAAAAGALAADAEVLDTFRAIAELKQQYSPEAIRSTSSAARPARRTCWPWLWLARLGGVQVEATRGGRSRA